MNTGPSPFTLLVRLLIGCALNIGALVLLAAWATPYFPTLSLSYVIGLGVLGWLVLPRLDDVDTMLDRLRRHNEQNT